MTDPISFVEDPVARAAEFLDAAVQHQQIWLVVSGEEPDDKQGVLRASADLAPIRNREDLADIAALAIRRLAAK